MATEGTIREGHYGNIHSVIVVRDGETIAEWYFAGPDERHGRSLGTVRFDADTLHDVRSVTRSVVSVLFGIALSDGAIGSIDDGVVTYFPDYQQVLSPAFSEVRLRHLLSMTSGIRWDERTYPYTDARNSEIAMDLAPDRIRYILSQPIDAPPGERWNYSGGDVALIAEIIARATEVPLDVYVKRRLFGPLGITSFEWVKDSAGDPIAASGLRLRPRDMAKIGQLILQSGRWQGQQVVSAEWAEESTSVQAQRQADLQCGGQYGYFWWLGSFCNADARTPWVLADGNGGQQIWIVPSENLVIVTTAGMYNQSRQTADDIVLAIMSPMAVPGLEP